MARVSIRSFSVIFFLGSLLAAILLTGCPEPPAEEEPVYRTDETDVLTVFLYDALTGAPISGTEMTGATAVVEVTNGGITTPLTTTEAENGMVDTTASDTSIKLYNFVANELIKVVIITPNYHKFESFVTPGAATRFPVYAAYLIPNSISASSPAYTVTLISNEDGAVLTDGNYLLTAGATALDVVDSTPTAGSATAPTVLTQYLGPNYGGDGTSGTVAPITGTVSATGTIDVAAGELYPGMTYTITVYGATGYGEQTLATTFIAGVTGTAGATAVTLTLSVNGLTEPALTLMAVGHIDAGGTPVINATRTLTYVFNYNIEAIYPLLQAGTLDLSSLVTLNTANSDGDADTTTAGDTADSADGSLPAGLTITAAANVLTVTLSATDAALTTGAADVAGTLDTDDSLTWGLLNIVGNIMIRRSGTTEAWTTLTGVGSSVAGHNFVNDSVVVVRW